MLLVLTGSADGTADQIFARIGNKGFRFNYDIFHDYSISITPDYWRIKNPAGHEIDSVTAGSAFWWKTFSFFPEDQDEYVCEEVKYIFREIYGWFVLRNKTRGNSPDYHRTMGKLNILSIASEFFTIPQTLCGWGELLKSTRKGGNAIVVKSLNSGLLTTNRALFTTEVDFDRLNLHFPWMVQEKINALFDVTIFICGEKTFAFRRDRKDLEGLDWRNQPDVFSTEQKWVLWDMSPGDCERTCRFIRRLGVQWGRIDLLDTGSELLFLEYNANGQFGFLDDRNEVGLFDEVTHYLVAN